MSTTSGTASPSLEEIHEQRPLLSPEAEAELFMLATNFLLYVALVIIVVIVAQIYFPESLQRGITTTVAPRSIYHTLDEGDEEEDEFDVEEEESESMGLGKQLQRVKNPQFSLEFMQEEEEAETMNSKFVVFPIATTEEQQKHHDRLIKEYIVIAKNMVAKEIEMSQLQSRTIPETYRKRNRGRK
jgi:hypothetical protein